MGVGGVATHWYLVRLKKCSPTLELQDALRNYLCHLVVVCWTPANINSWLPGILLTGRVWNKNEFILLFFKQIFIECLLCAEHCSREGNTKLAKRDLVPTLLELSSYITWKRGTKLGTRNTSMMFPGWVNTRRKASHLGREAREWWGGWFPFYAGCSQKASLINGIVSKALKEMKEQIMWISGRRLFQKRAENSGIIQNIN